MALGLASTVGFTGFRFVTALTGATAGVVYYVASGPGRIGSAGLIIDVMPSGVTEVVVRGGGVDTQFSLRGIGSINERSVLLAGLASGQSDAQQRAAVGGAASVSDGVAATGLLRGAVVVPPAPTPPPSFTTQPSISPTSGTAGTTTFTATPGTVSNGSITSRAWKLAGTTLATGLNFAPSSAQSGTLTYQETATGTDGSTILSAVQPVVVAAAAVTAPGYIATVASAPHAAYGAQRVVSGYSGPLFQLRRSDGTTMDVAAQSGGDYPDYAAITTWAGGTIATVPIIYDQTGNGRHFTQATVANQPSFDVTQKIGNFVPILLDSLTQAVGANAAVFKQMAASVNIPGNALTVFTANQPLVSEQGRTNVSFNVSATPGTGFVATDGNTRTVSLALSTQGGSLPILSNALKPVRANWQTSGARYKSGTSAPSRAYLYGGFTDNQGSTAATTTPYLLMNLGGGPYISTSNDRSRFLAHVVYAAALSDADAAAVSASMDTLSAISNTFDYRLVLIGDSITEGIGKVNGLNVVTQMTLSQRAEIINTGISGETMATEYSNRVVRYGGLATSVYGTGKSLFVIRSGINDLVANNSTGSQLYAIATNMLTYLKGLNANVKVGIQTLGPTTTYVTGQRETERQNYNALVLANSAGFDAVQDRASESHLANPADTTIYQDGLHPTALGYKYDAQTVVSLMTSLLGATP